MTSRSNARRAAVYHRVSTLDQNPTLLRSELRAAVKRLGYRIVLDIEETGSQTRPRRPFRPRPAREPPCRLPDYRLCLTV
jgi:predicted site-specific integrase-resolvase